jgi:epoxyqueuosine reductase
LEISDTPATVANLCGHCTRCIDACPSSALNIEGYLDANKCLSYLTIEHGGQFENYLHNRVYGCDICQDVCPWNSKAIPTRVPELKADEKLLGLSREEWLKMNKEQYDRLFKGTAVERGKWDRISRNIASIARSGNKKAGN